MVPTDAHPGRHPARRAAEPAGRQHQRLSPAVPRHIYHYRPWASLTLAEQDALDLEMAVYAAMVDRLARNIGRVIARLKALDALDNTHTHFIAHWPDTIAPGRTDQLAHVADLLPTMLDLAGAAYPESADGAPTPALDGQSLLPVFRGETRPAPAMLIAGLTGCFRMVRMGDWKNRPRQRAGVEANALRDGCGSINRSSAPR